MGISLEVNEEDGVELTVTQTLQTVEVISSPSSSVLVVHDYQPAISLLVATGPVGPAGPAGDSGGSHDHNDLYVRTVNGTPPDETGNVVVSGGGEGGVSDHGALTGLSDDDHPQYALADGSRGAFAPTSHNHDDRYYTETEVDTLLAGKQAAGSYATPTDVTNASTADRDRANHTGTQTSASISDFTEAVQDAVALLLTAGSNVALNYDDATNSLTISSTDLNTTDPETIRDTIGVALVGAGPISITVNDAGDTITIASAATVNSTDAQLRDRATHTGTQAISTVDGLQTALDGKAASTHTHAIADVTGLQADLDDKAADVTALSSRVTTLEGFNQVLVLGAADPVPPGTPVNTLIVRPPA